MKMKLISAVILALCCASARAQFTYANAASSGSSSCIIFIPGIGSRSTVIEQAACTSDLSSATLTLQAGTVAHTITVANASTSATNLIVEATAGFYSNDTVVVQAADGTCISRAVWGTANSTNVYLTAALSQAQAVGDQVNRLGTNTVGMGVDKVTLKFCNCTASYGGGNLFSAPSGRPICATLTGTSACSIDNLSIAYK